VCQLQLLNVAAQMEPVEALTSSSERTSLVSSTTTPVRQTATEHPASKRWGSLALASACLSLPLAIGSSALALSRGCADADARPVEHVSSREVPDGAARSIQAVVLPDATARTIQTAVIPPISNLDPLVVEIWPEVDASGRVVLRMRNGAPPAGSPVPTRATALHERLVLERMPPNGPVERAPVHAIEDRDPGRR
jgi:hypothetical protein